MNSRSSVANDTFPSLSSGLGADGVVLRQFESSVDRIVSGNRPQDRTSDSDAHAVTYNSRFQFFHSKRTSTINDSPINDLASREDSLVKAWRTVTEIDALLGSDFRPSMPTCEEDRPNNPVDETYVKRLNTELEAAINVSLTFKERYRATGRGNRHAAGPGGAGWFTFLGPLGPAALAPAAAAAAVTPAAGPGAVGPTTANGGAAAAASAAAQSEMYGAPGGGSGGTKTEPGALPPRAVASVPAPLHAFPAPAASPRYRHSDASGVLSPPSSFTQTHHHHHQQQQHLQQNQQQYNYNYQQHHHHHHHHHHQAPHASASTSLLSPRLTSSTSASGAAALASTAAPTTPLSAPVSGSGGGGGGGGGRGNDRVIGGGGSGAAAAAATAAAANAAATVAVVTAVLAGSGAGKSPPHAVHTPAPPATPGPPLSPRSVQLHSAAPPPLSPRPAGGGRSSTPPSPSAVVAAAPLSPAVEPLYRRLQGGGIRVAVGSALDHGVWDSDGIWRPADPVHEVYIPTNLQRISPDDLVKVRELGRGCFGSVWLAKWRGVEVALKELLNQTCLDGPPNEVFYEAERLASLRHPCVIAFYGIVTAPGCYATVVEYLRMGSLKSGLTRLRKQGADISKRLRAAIALQAARGMEYLHTQFLVHFDLKCDNLLCDLRDPARPVVKIGDLGLSKKKKDSFVSGNMRGTLPWMAPELFPGVREKQRQEEEAAEAEAADVNGCREAVAVANGSGGGGGGGVTHSGMNGGGGGGGGGAAAGISGVAGTARTNCSGTDFIEDRVNEKVDVFSFGVVLWEIWQLGEQPYSSYSLADIFAGVMTGSLRPGLPADCDPEWAALMQACWHGNPRSRPSFTEIAERLEAILERLTLQEAAEAATPGSIGAGGPGQGGARRF